MIVVTKTRKDDVIFGAATSSGSPLAIKMPETPGEYELRYVLQQGSTVLATRPITVNEERGMPSVPLNASWLKMIAGVVLVFIVLPI